MSVSSLTHPQRESLRHVLQASLRDILGDDSPNESLVQRHSPPLTAADLAATERSKMTLLRSFHVSDVLPGQGPSTSALIHSLGLSPHHFPTLGMPLGVSSHDILYAAATNAAMKSSILEQTRMAIIQKSINEEKARIYMTSLRNQAALQSKLLTTKHTSQTLNALGSSLRTRADPYIDVSHYAEAQPVTSRRPRGGVAEPFPEKLHRMLNEVVADGHGDIVSFYAHGRAFGVHDMDRFCSEIMPKYFKQSKWNSFARQLNLYGFLRISNGPDAGGYYHELFLKGRPALSPYMRRVGVPAGDDRRKIRPKQQSASDPDFYAMRPV